jgi:hypothetical protein
MKMSECISTTRVRCACVHPAPAVLSARSLLPIQWLARQRRATRARMASTAWPHGRVHHAWHCIPVPYCLKHSLTWLVPSSLLSPSHLAQLAPRPRSCLARISTWVTAFPTLLYTRKQPCKRPLTHYLEPHCNLYIPCLPLIPLTLNIHRRSR